MDAPWRNAPGLIGWVELDFRLKRTEEAAKFRLFSGFFGSSKLSKVLNNISQNWGFVKVITSKILLKINKKHKNQGNPLIMEIMVQTK